MGVVAAVGEGVDEVAVGDAVCFVGGAFAEYAGHCRRRRNRCRCLLWTGQQSPPPLPPHHHLRYSVVKAQGLWIVPEAAPEYVGLRISALTSCAMLEETGKLRKGETVLITAAAGGAGHFAVQLAKLAGCTVIGTCSSAEKAAVLRELGCDHIINHRTQDVAAELLKIAPEGLDVVLEGVGGQMLKTALGSLGPKGRLLQVGYISEYPHNKNREAEAAHHGEDTASLFWKAETIHRADQVHWLRLDLFTNRAGTSLHHTAQYPLTHRPPLRMNYHPRR